MKFELWINTVAELQYTRLEQDGMAKNWVILKII